MDNNIIRPLVRGAYDLQKLRIQMGNRVAINFKAKLGQEPSKKENTLDADAKNILRMLRNSYKRITDGIIDIRRITAKSFKGDEVISEFGEFCLVTEYLNTERSEQESFKLIEKTLKQYPLYAGYLEKIKGVGPLMGAVIISEIDIHKARHPSSLWKYAGLDVAGDGMGRSRKKEHLTDVAYTDKNGKEQTKKGITFNPFLKTKLMGVLAASFLKVGENPYRKIYLNYKHRMENHVRWGIANDKEKDDKGFAITSKGRRHNQAMRYMIKMFLIDLYTHWRALEKLPVSLPYHEAKLGMKHGEAA